MCSCKAEFATLIKLKRKTLLQLCKEIEETMVETDATMTETITSRVEADVMKNEIKRIRIGIDVVEVKMGVVDEIMMETETTETAINEVDQMMTITPRGTEDTSARRMTIMVETHATSRSVRDLAEMTTRGEVTSEVATTGPLDPDLRQATTATLEEATAVVVEVVTEVDSEEVGEEALEIEVGGLVAAVIETMLRSPRTHTRCK